MVGEGVLPKALCPTAEVLPGRPDCAHSHCTPAMQKWPSSALPYFKKKIYLFGSRIPVLYLNKDPQARRGNQISL